MSEPAQTAGPDVVALLQQIAQQIAAAGAQTSGTEPYMTVEQAATFLGIKEKTVRNLMHNGTLRLGVHWFRAPGLGPRFSRAALIAWIEGKGAEATPAEGRAYGPDIPRDRPRRRRLADAA